MTDGCVLFERLALSMNLMIENTNAYFTTKPQARPRGCLAEALWHDANYAHITNTKSISTLKESRTPQIRTVAVASISCVY